MRPHRQELPPIKSLATVRAIASRTRLPKNPSSSSSGTAPVPTSRARPFTATYSDVVTSVGRDDKRTVVIFCQRWAVTVSKVVYRFCAAAFNLATKSAV